VELYVVRADGGILQRMIGDRGYKEMWRRYKTRVLIAMSAQAFAQLVSALASICVSLLTCCESQNGINGASSRMPRRSDTNSLASQSSLTTLPSSSNLLDGSDETQSS
jgi:hypothetical protein